MTGGGLFYGFLMGYWWLIKILGRLYVWWALMRLFGWWWIYYYFWGEWIIECDWWILLNASNECLRLRCYLSILLYYFFLIFSKV